MLDKIITKYINEKFNLFKTHNMFIKVWRPNSKLLIKTTNSETMSKFSNFEELKLLKKEYGGYLKICYTPEFVVDEDKIYWLFKVEVGDDHHKTFQCLNNLCTKLDIEILEIYDDWVINKNHPAKI